jgi:hypothetical protein
MSYDFKLGSNKLYNPVHEDRYLGPNGLSLQPLGSTLAEILESLPTNFIYELPKGLILPDNVVLLNE